MWTHLSPDGFIFLAYCGEAEFFKLLLWQSDKPVEVWVCFPLFWNDPEPEPIALRFAVVPTTEAILVDAPVKFSDGFTTLLPPDFI